MSLLFVKEIKLSVYFLIFRYKILVFRHKVYTFALAFGKRSGGDDKIDL